MHLPAFFMKQKLTLMVNRYEIRGVGPDGGPGDLIAFAQQKRMAFKEQVTFYSDEQRTRAVFSFKARQVIDLSSGYDVYDERGDAIGFFRKDFGKSLLRSTFHLNGPHGLDAIGQERNQAIAIIRRFIELPFTFHFDFVDQAGRPVMHVDRQFSMRDRYQVQVPDPRLDFRLAAAMTVALDALMGR
ncbi:hypothetical protein EFK50_15950 [Nocardioides marmoriginsengisoli]|uniref:Scramblase n=2 Tax=Nocardioides marmoriginsengisoli TaxID=661483 RepID=A0A3N0CKG4_9ACTN|nr:hypothetical protein EFK50_15950 [Nocardioides marmoriginsengisoli]